MVSLPNIVIDQQFGALGIEITPAQMKITTPNPKMQITSEAPEMTVENQMPEFKLNWTKVRAESGLKTPDLLAKSLASDAVRTAEEGTVDAVHDGDYIAKVQERGNRIAKLSHQKTIRTEQVEINLSSIPQSLPEVEWDRGYVHINWTRGTLNIDWVGDYMPEVVVDPPFSVEIYLREKPYIKVMVEDGTMPIGTGAIVDQQL